MIGAIAGDIAGSRFERQNHRSRDFDLFTDKCRCTDDSVLTVAVCEALLKSNPDFSDLPEQTESAMRTAGRDHPFAGYGGSFIRWLAQPSPKPYRSFGNGAAMRTSGCGYAASSLEETKRISGLIAGVTHNHPEGVKGAEAVSCAIYQARTGSGKAALREFVVKNYYKLDFTLDEIRETYQFDVSCQGSVPQAFEAFFEAADFEETIRNAVSIGGDSDTIAAVAGSIAEAFYGVPRWMEEKALSYMDDWMRSTLAAFDSRWPSAHRINPE